MAVPYYLYQDNRKNGNKMWYARTTHFGVVDEFDLARQAQANCTLKESDCLAAVTELLEVIGYELGNGNEVYLDRFGYFKPAITSKGSLTKDKFSPDEYITDVRVNFQPCKKVVSRSDSVRAVRSPWQLGVKFQKVSGPLYAKKKGEGNEEVNP